MDNNHINIDLDPIYEDLARSFSFSLDLFFVKIPILTLLTLITLAGYIGIFKPDIDPSLPVFFRPLITIAFWSVTQTIWQAVSEWLKITFGVAFQVAILVIVGVIINTAQANSIVIDARVCAAWALLLISAAMLDNLPRLFTSDVSPLNWNLKKEKRKNRAFEESTRHNLQDDTAGTIPYEVTLDALIEEARYEHH